MTNFGQTRTEKIRPAIDELDTAQDALFSELERGFDDRRDLVLWFHKASTRTLGRIPDDWPLRVLRNQYSTNALLNREEGPGEALAAFERSLVRDDALLEACSASMRFMATRADQYAEGRDKTQGQGRSHKFGEQRWLLMRPSYDELVTRQRNALERVLGRTREYPDGLTSREDVSRWVRAVLRASRGIDDGLSREAIWSPLWRQTLTDDPRHGDLHLMLADQVLSVFNQALREEAVVANEQPDEQGQRQEEFQT